MEWDTNPGVQEVQTITTSTYTGANEVQSVTTSAQDVDEIQVVATSGSAHPEIQTMRTFAAPGQTLGGSFTVQLDTIPLGGSIQRSGVINYNAPATGSRDSMLEILRSMSNLGASGVTDVQKTGPDAEGGFTWTITFADALGNVPELTLLSSNLLGTGADVEIKTTANGNELGGAFTLTFGSSTTADIAHDATDGDVKTALEALEPIGTVEVQRGLRSAQGGYRWTITFTSDKNAGNLDLMTFTNHLTGVGAAVNVEDSRHGNQLSGSFTLTLDAQTTDPIDFDASEDQMKTKILAKIGSISAVEVERIGPDPELGYTWTISFTAEKGDINAFTYNAAALLESRDDGGSSATITIDEVRQGTDQEIQDVASSTIGANVAADVWFQLRFTRGADVLNTGPIYANPDGDGTCLPSGHEVQEISTSTVDSTGFGGDNIVDPESTFKLVFSNKGVTESTTDIPANGADGDCSHGATAIQDALEALESVTGTVSVTFSAPDPQKICTWKVTFDNISGNLDQMQVIAGSNGPAASATTGDDTITIVPDTDGTVDMIKTELEKLANVGLVTVTATPGAQQTCTWHITFDTNAGDLTLMDVSVESSAYGATANDGTDTITVSNNRDGTSVSLGGLFTLEFDGQRTEYLPYDIDADQMQAALETLSTIGNVDVVRSEVDPNNGYTWTVSFINNLGDLSPLLSDVQGMSGTVPNCNVAEATQGVYPPFNSRDPANGTSF